MFFNNFTEPDVRNIFGFLNRASYSFTEAEELVVIKNELSKGIDLEKPGVDTTKIDLSLEQINFILSSFEKANLVGTEAKAFMSLVDKLTEAYKNKAQSAPANEGQPLINFTAKEETTAEVAETEPSDI